MIVLSINDLAQRMGDACYAFLAINFLWGLYNIIVGFRRQRRLSFANTDEQAEFMEQVMEPLREGRYNVVTELCTDETAAHAAADRPGGDDAACRSTSCGRW